MGYLTNKLGGFIGKVWELCLQKLDLNSCLFSNTQLSGIGGNTQDRKRT